MGAAQRAAKKSLQNDIARCAIRRSAIGALCITAAVLAGCAAFKPATPEEAVTKRAQARWASMMQKDFAKAYTYFTPYIKATTTQDAYVAELGQGNNWLAADVVGVTCEQQLCKAKVRISVPSPIPGKFGDKITTHIDEDWVLVDGDWWFNRR